MKRLDSTSSKLTYDNFPLILPENKPRNILITRLFVAFIVIVVGGALISGLYFLIREFVGKKERFVDINEIKEEENPPENSENNILE